MLLVSLFFSFLFFCSQEETVETALLQCGDIVKVLPGEKIPVDGVVEQGSTSVDESMLTGRQD